MISYHSDTPHIVRPKGSGQYSCDANCAQWVSSKICSHTVAVAHLNGSLEEFLSWYVSCAPQPNITSLAMTGMPPGRGKKKNQMQRSRKKVCSAPPDATVTPVTSCSAHVHSKNSLVVLTMWSFLPHISVGRTNTQCSRNDQTGKNNKSSQNN